MRNKISDNSDLQQQLNSEVLGAISLIPEKYIEQDLSNHTFSFEDINAIIKVFDNTKSKILDKIISWGGTSYKINNTVVQFPEQLEYQNLLNALSEAIDRLNNIKKKYFAVK